MMQSNTMSPRAATALARVRKHNEAEQLKKRRGFSILVAMWIILSGMAFRDVIVSESARPVDWLIAIGMSLGYAVLILIAWSRLVRRSPIAK
jgi:hypothetical protein